MSNRLRIGTVLGGVGLAVLVGIVSLGAQGKPLVNGSSVIETLLTVDLAQVGLMGTNVAQRVTIAPGIATADHTHRGRTSIMVLIQGSMTEVRGTVKSEYKTGDVVAVAEGTTHHAENHGEVPLVYIEINTTSKN